MIQEPRKTGLLRIASGIRTRLVLRGIGSFGPGSSIGAGVRIYNKRLVRIGSHTRIDDYVCLNGLGENGLTIGSRCQVRFGCLIDCWKGKGIRIGDDTFIGPLSVIQGQGGTSIGSRCLIGGHAYIVPASHVFSDPSRPIQDQGETRKGITIEDDVWTGCGVRILDGVRIGRGSVIGAGSVVTRDIPPMSVAYGVPARIRRKRGQEGPDSPSGVSKPNRGTELQR